VISKSVYERLEFNKGFLAQTPIMVKGKTKEIENWIYNAI
jgi:hypothetical protein